LKHAKKDWRQSFFVFESQQPYIQIKSPYCHFLHRSIIMRYWILIVLFTSPWAIADSERYSPSIAASKASLNVSGSAAHALVTSGKATLAVSVAPLAIGASVGLVGGSVAGTSANASDHASTNNSAQPIGTPLPITSEVITITPPDQALQPLTPPNQALQPDTTERKP
jgi:hypothetical protein